MNRKLFNLDALFALICGLVFLFNPLLGPKLPVSAGIVSALGGVLLFAAIVLGQAGMGKGPLLARLRTVAVLNLAGGAALVVSTAVTGSFTSTGRVFVWVVSAFLVALGAAQLLLGGRRSQAQHKRSTQAQRLEAIGRGRE